MCTSSVGFFDADLSVDGKRSGEVKPAVLGRDAARRAAREAKRERRHRRGNAGRRRGGTRIVLF